MFESLLRRALRAGARFADLRFERAESTHLSLRDGAFREVSSGTATGVGIRVLGRSWGFAATTDPGRAGRALEQALRLSRLRGRRVAWSPRGPHREEFRLRVKRDPAGVPLERKMSLLRRAERSARERPLQSVQGSYADARLRKIYMNTEGTRVSSDYPRVFAGIRAVARENTNVQEGYGRAGAVAGYDYLERMDPRRMAREAARRARALLRAGTPRGGRMPVVMDPHLTGVFSHEAVGHAAEADHILLGESLLAGRVGRRIGSPLYSLSDDPTVSPAYGFYRFDDEGTPGRATRIVERGVLRGLLHSRESAAALGMEPTANGRAEGFVEVPIVRMSTLTVAPGDMDLDELLDVPRGIYALGMHGGQVDTVAGNFQFGAEEAFEIRRGERGRRLRNVSLSGNTLETLRRIDGVGRRVDRRGSIGYCGKQGQTVPVAEICPHLRVSEVLVGGA